MFVFYFKSLEIKFLAILNIFHFQFKYTDYKHSNIGNYSNTAFHCSSLIRLYEALSSNIYSSKITQFEFRV